MNSKENKNIVLLFLSDVKSFDKKLTYYKYKSLNESDTITAAHSNEVSVKYLLEKLSSSDGIDTIFMLCSKKVREGKPEIDGEYSNMPHVEIYKKIISTFCVQQKYKIPDFKIIEFDEDKSGEDMIKPVIDMMKDVKDKYGYNRYNVNAYLDITGGLRHSTLLMNTLLRFLKYHNIDTKQVLYAQITLKDINNKDGNNKLEDVTELYNLFDFVSGAEEFVNYGSVKTLLEYASTISKSEELEKLLKSMDEFSECIKLVCASELSQCIQNLVKHFNEFKRAVKASENNKSTVNVSISDKIFALIIERMQEEYKEIFNTGAKLPDYILWCNRKGLIQQAVTLYSEKLPEYLIAQKICYPNNCKNNEEIEKYTKEAEKEGKSWQEYFLLHHQNYETCKDRRKVNIVLSSYKDFKKVYRNSINHGNTKIKENNIKKTVENFQTRIENDMLAIKKL